MIENASDAKIMAQVVLNAITSKEPQLRYLAGKDMEAGMDTRNNMSDSQLHDMIKQNLLKKLAGRESGWLLAWSLLL
jgi:hypothetical protein